MTENHDLTYFEPFNDQVQVIMDSIRKDQIGSVVATFVVAVDFRQGL